LSTLFSLGGQKERGAVTGNDFLVHHTTEPDDFENVRKRRRMWRKRDNASLWATGRKI
jgi:hypothetical protein